MDLSLRVAAAATAHWMFGNLYEELVLMPPALVRPQPGFVVGPLDAGSPLWYYGPSLPVTVASAWVAATRPEADRRTRRAAVAITVAAALKVALITRVNPGFRDASVPAEEVRTKAKVWLLGNGVTVVALAAALVDLLRGARPGSPR